MQMNVLRMQQVSHVGSRDDHGQPIAGGDDQKCQRRVGSRSTGIQEPSCAVTHYWRVDVNVNVYSALLFINL